jgi:hypothetical protein
MAQQGVSCYDKRRISCYTVTTCPIVIFCFCNKYKNLQEENEQRHKAYGNIKAEKDVLAKTSSLRKASAKNSINFTTLQRFCKKLEAGIGGKCYILKFLEFNLEV